MLHETWLQYEQKYGSEFLQVLYPDFNVFQLDFHNALFNNFKEHYNPEVIDNLKHIPPLGVMSCETRRRFEQIEWNRFRFYLLDDLEIKLKFGFINEGQYLDRVMELVDKEPSINNERHVFG